MPHRLLAFICAGLALLSLSVAHADPLPPHFDDTVPPTSGTGDAMAFPTTIPCGKTLLIPVAASNPGGGPLVYSATSSNPAIMVRVRTGNPVLNLTISHDPAVSGTDLAVSGTDVAVSGTLQLMLFRDLTPNTAQIIGGLAQGGFYDSLTFHRIIPGFMAQGGDPSGDGTGGPAFKFDNEFKLPLIFTGKGQLAMANSGWDASGKGTNGSQFFITYNSPATINTPYTGPRWLDFNHTIFGQLLRGWDTFQLMSMVTTGTTTKPDSKVTITKAVVTKTDDAVLFLTASGTGAATISVSISRSGTGNTPVTTSFSVNSVVDTVNDPVILTPPVDTVAPLKGSATIVLQAQDLECDEIGFGYQLLGTSANRALVSSNSNGSKLIVRGNPIEYAGKIDLEVGAKQINQSARGSTSSPFDLNMLSIGVADKAFVPQPANLSLRSGTTPALIVAGSFLDKDSTATGASYYGATINWGDGTLSTGTNVTVAKDPKSGSSARFLVSGNHAYPNPGIYPVRVTVLSFGGATAKFVGVANVSGNSLLASGLTVSSNGGNIVKQPVALFQDQTPLAVEQYKTVIDWGDGVSTTGTVLKATGTTSFKVVGSHRYLDSATYPVNVSILKGTEEVNAWSTALVSRINKPPFVPPLTQAHLSQTFIFTQLFHTEPGVNSQMALSGTLTIRNTGNKVSTPATLTFHYSTDGKLEGSTQLQFMGKDQYAIPAIAPGGQVAIPMVYNNTPAAFVNTLLFWPPGSNYNNAYVGTSILFKLNWSDPLADLLPIPKILQLGPWK